MGWGVEVDGLSVIFDKVIPDFITKKLPDVLILGGDRYETFIAAVSAVILKIKIVLI